MSLKMLLYVAQLAQETYDTDVLPLLIRNLSKLDFESKKDVALVFNNLLGRKIGTRSPTVEYLCTRPEILLALVNGYVTQAATCTGHIFRYELSEIATVCGLMARQCIRNEDLANIMLQSEQLYDFFEYVESPTFDVASDAFQTFRVNRTYLSRVPKPKPKN